MKLEDQVVSLELAKKLKELGFSQESLFYWVGESLCFKNVVEVEMAKLDTNQKDFYSAYTVAELGEMLPVKVKHHSLDIFRRNKVSWHVCYLDMTFDTPVHPNSISYLKSGNTQADAMAKMLIYLKENNLI